MANIIVTKTVNEVTWQSDQSAYNKVLKQIRSTKAEWEKIGKSFSPKTSPAATFNKAVAEQRLVAKRLNQTTRAEAAKTSAHAIALAKKESRARDAIAKIENARRKQAVSRITAGRSPESQADYNGLKAQLRQQAKNGFVGGTNPAIAAARQQALQEELARRKSSSNASGMVGNSTGYNPETVAAQNRAMAQQARQQKQIDAAQLRQRQIAQRKQEAEDLRYSKYLAGKESTVSNASVRLRSKYGDNYATKLKGFDSLKERFLDSNSMKSSNFNAELAAMEKNLRRADASALSFSDGLKGLRNTLISVTAVYGAFGAASKIVSTGQFFQGMEATMLMVSDNSVEAGKRMQFVQQQAYRLGLDLKVASQGYTQMAIAADGVISKSDNDKLFKSFSEYATALQTDPVKYQRGITAIQQMLGKGQVQAEELKQQLAEAIPGSMKAFVAAAQRYFKDDKIGVSQLQDLMKNGKLLAKDILPLVAEEYAKMANKGGALDKALKSNRVAMQQLQYTWMQFMNKIFESGFGDQLTSAFKDLAQMLDQNGPLAQAVGQFVSGFIKGFMDIVNTVYNTFVLIGGLFARYIPMFRDNGEEMSSAFKWVGWGVGALFFAASLVRVFNILAKIAGLAAGLKFLKDIFGGGGDEGGGDGPGKSKNKGPRFGKLGKVARFLGLYGLITGESMIAGDYVFDKAQEYSDSTYGTETTAGGNLKANSWMGRTWDWFAGERQMTDQRRLDYLNQNNMMPGGSSAAQPPMVIPTEPVSGEIKVTIDAGGLKDMITQQIETSNMGNINLITGVPN